MPDPITLVTTPRKASEGVKDRLVMALDFADKEGCSGVAIAFVTGDGNTASLMYIGDSIAALLGSVQRLNHRLLLEE